MLRVQYVHELVTVNLVFVNVHYTGYFVLHEFLV